MQKRLMIILNIIILLIFFYNTLYSAEHKGGYLWMLLPVSARGAGIGQGVAAIIDNANTVFWNPGGVGFLDDSLCINYSYNPLAGNWIWNDEFHNFAVNAKIAKNIVSGLNYKYFNSGYSIAKYYSIGILFNYKKGNIGFGINTNLHSIYNAQNNPVLSYDFGILYSKDLNNKLSSILKNISFGTSILNISSGAEYSDHIKRGLPCNVRIGYSITLIYPRGKNDKHPLIITHNLEYSDVLNSNNAFYRRDIGGGMECLFSGLLYFRLGYHSRGCSYSPIKGITYGTGLIFPLQYIFHNFNSSITYDFSMYRWMPDSSWKKDEYYQIHSFGFKYNY